MPCPAPSGPIGVAGGSTQTPIALWIAIITRCVLASEWLIPFAPYAALPARVLKLAVHTGTSRYQVSSINHIVMQFNGFYLNKICEQLTSLAEIHNLVYLTF